MRNIRRVSLEVQQTKKRSTFYTLKYVEELVQLDSIKHASEGEFPFLVSFSQMDASHVCERIVEEAIGMGEVCEWQEWARPIQPAVVPCGIDDEPKTNQPSAMHWSHLCLNKQWQEGTNRPDLRSLKSYENEAGQRPDNVQKLKKASHTMHLSSPAVEWACRKLDSIEEANDEFTQLLREGIERRENSRMSITNENMARISSLPKASNSLFAFDYNGSRIAIKKPCQRASYIAQPTKMSVKRDQVNSVNELITDAIEKRKSRFLLENSVMSELIRPTAEQTHCKALIQQLQVALYGRAITNTAGHRHRSSRTQKPLSKPSTSLGDITHLPIRRPS